METIVFVAVAYICLLNVCIGLYLGVLGADGFAHPRPVALLIMLLGMGAPLLLLYAQKNHGFMAQPKHIATSVVFFAIAYIAGRGFRRKISGAKTDKAVNNLNSIHKKAANAGMLWREKDYTDARILYQEIEKSISLPLDRAKIMANIAQLYAEESNKTEALNTANIAIKIIHDNELYKSLEGSHLRGYLNGFINRLQDKGTWKPLSYDKNISIEMNLNVFDRVRAHFSVAVISGAIFSILSSELNIPSIDISLFHKKIIVFSLSGFLFSIFFTSGILKQSIVTIMTIFKRDVKNSLKPAVNLLSIIAVLYLIVFPSAVWSMASEIAFFILTGFLGVCFFYGFIFRRHYRRIDE